jgi:hypothetical protein
MQDLIFRFLKNSGIDPIYFITGILDVIAVFLWGRLKANLSNWQRAFYKAIILVAIALTAGAVCKFYGLITE